MTPLATMSGADALAIAEAMVGEARIMIDACPHLSDAMRRLLHRQCNDAVVEFMLKLVPQEGHA